MRFMGCRHATTRDLAYMEGRGPTPGEATEDTELLRKRGDAHEAAYLANLKAAGRSVVEIAGGALEHDADATKAALADGPDIVFQAAFLSGDWGGWADFLERVDTPSNLGAFSYEVTDTKLKRRVHPKHVLQLVLYSDRLAEVQGVPPAFAHVALGDGSRATLRLAEYAHYARAARVRLEAFVADPPQTRPVPCADCALCRWAEHCAGVWQAEDSLFTVANLTRSQARKLEAAGITTMAALAANRTPVKGMAGSTLSKLTAQARLQNARKTGAPAYQLREAEAGKGFALLPRPQPGDLFYDIEGDPHYDGGLEYLHGVWCDGSFRAFWAHDHAAEKAALADLLAYVRDHLTQCPDARIYHYAAYEITALRRLTTKYGVGEVFLDRLQREKRFVDLFAVVRGAVLASEPNYSLKSLEVFYDLARDGEVKTAGGSVVAYEEWRETGEPAILDEIEAYNRLDCQSTALLRDWLVSIRPEEDPWPTLDADAGDKEVEDDQDVVQLRAALAAADLPENRREMLFNLGFFRAPRKTLGAGSRFDRIGWGFGNRGRSDGSDGLL